MQRLQSSVTAMVRTRYHGARCTVNKLCVHLLPLAKVNGNVDVIIITRAISVKSGHRDNLRSLNFTDLKTDYISKLEQNMAQGDPLKWSMPGWRIEQRYANGVLIGNWSEERHKVGQLSMILFRPN